MSLKVVFLFQNFLVLYMYAKINLFMLLVIKDLNRFSN